MSKFRILCLDGGGIRGLYTAVILDRIVTAVPTFLADIHLYAGTSTGGILALGLAVGRTPQEGVLLYEQWGPRIFSRSWSWKLRTLWGLVGAKYDNAALHEAVASELGGLTMNDLAQRDKFVLISSFDLDKGQGTHHRWKPKFFHNFPDPTGDPNALLTDVAMCTSAAPTYFPSYNGFVDGGVAANSPTMAALAQALDPGTGGQQLADVRLISFGTGQSPNFIAGQRNNWGLLQWASPAIPVMLEGSMDAQNYECSRVLGMAQYHRLNKPLPEPVELDDVDSMDELVQFANNVDIAPTVAWIEQNFL
jgi:patatin-like phospholipase/acyl hydrolase